jgi:hypothetical protein
MKVAARARRPGPAFPWGVGPSLVSGRMRSAGLPLTVALLVVLAIMALVLSDRFGVI